MAAIDTSGFQPRTLDKVERLLDLLDEMQRHPDLKGKLAMHGGTAINLFMLDIPRLSVDIDISYVGALAREEMLRERPFIERAIEEVGRGQGYDVSAGDGGHAGRTFVLRYRGDWGTDHVKIDCIYMNRSPLFPHQKLLPSPRCRRPHVRGCRACGWQGQGLLRQSEDKGPLRHIEPQGALRRHGRSRRYRSQGAPLLRIRLRMLSERVRRPEQAVRRSTEGPRGADAGRLDRQCEGVHIGLHSAARRRRETLFGIVRQGGIPSRAALRRVRHRPSRRREPGSSMEAH